MMHNYNALEPGGTMPKEPHSEPSGEASATTHTLYVVIQSRAADVATLMWSQ